MKGIELFITDDDQLAIRCLEHGTVHTGKRQFCCVDVMVRAMTMAIKQVPEGFHARLNGAPKETGLTGTLFDIGVTSLFNSN
jgi:hypothetical protein